LTDAFGRRVEYLRVSLTDRCNYRCVYCMPLAGLPWIRRADVLTDDEVVTVVRELAALGLRRVRLTGGEPTLRPTLVDLVGRLHALGVLEDLSLSTNGVRLAAQASALRAAGLDRVNVSVDSLDPHRAARIARRSLGFDPLAALAAAEDAGLAPVKVNVVVMRGRQRRRDRASRRADDRAAVARALHRTHAGGGPRRAARGRRGTARGARGPERRGVGACGGVRHARRRPLLAGRGPSGGNGPAAYHRFSGGAGAVGLITPIPHVLRVVQPRPADRRRALRPCLYGEGEVDLRPALRAGLPLAPLVREALAGKPREHAL
jgi:cyclic pyranopterin phosphate synthase